MIVPVKDAAFIERIRPLVEKIKTPYEIDQYLEYMRSTVSRDDVLLLVDLDDKRIKSFVFSEVLTNIGYQSLFVDLAYITPKSKEISKDFLNFLEKFAELNGCDRISIMAEDKRAKAFAKKYSFEAKSIYLERKINKTEVLHERHI